MYSYQFLPDRQKLKRFLINGIINIDKFAARHGEMGSLIPYMEETINRHRPFIETKFENIRFNPTLKCIFFRPITSLIRIYPTDIVMQDSSIYV